jgi:hypothetical protein
VSLLPRSAWILYQRPLVIVQRSVPITIGTLTIDSLRFVPLHRLVVPTIGQTHKTMFIVKHLEFNVDSSFLSFDLLLLTQ